MNEIVFNGVDADVEIIPDVFDFECPHCKNKLKFQNGMEYGEYTCPYCGGSVTPVQKQMVVQRGYASVPVVSEFKYKCPFCKTVLDVDARFEFKECSCPTCGNTIVPERNVNVGVRVSHDQGIVNGYASGRNEHAGSVVVNNMMQDNSLNNAIPRVSRVAYIILAIFFFKLGIHDFYARRAGFGLVYLLTTLFTLFSLELIILVLVIQFICMVVELFAVSRDGFGRPMV